MWPSRRGSPDERPGRNFFSDVTVGLFWIYYAEFSYLFVRFLDMSTDPYNLTMHDILDFPMLTVSADLSPYFHSEK